MSTPKNRPFKKFFCDRLEVFLLPPAAFKIWLYHYSREGSARESWPGIKTLCEKLNLDRHSVCRWRGWLIANGWLERIGERQGSNGRFSVPVFKVTRGSIPAKNQDGRALNRVRKLSTQIGVKTLHVDRCENFALEVDSEMQVDEISVRRNERTRNLRTPKSVSPSGSPQNPLVNAGFGVSVSDGKKIETSEYVAPCVQVARELRELRRATKLQKKRRRFNLSGGSHTPQRNATTPCIRPLT